MEVHLKGQFIYFHLHMRHYIHTQINFVLFRQTGDGKNRTDTYTLISRQTKNCELAYQINFK